MLLGYQGLKFIGKSGFLSRGRGGGMGGGGMGCGGRRNITLKPLPEFYVLPSGDKIPSVALGAFYSPSLNILFPSDSELTPTQLISTQLNSGK